MLDIDPTEKTENSFKFNLTNTFNLIVQDFYENYTEEEILDTYLFMVQIISIIIGIILRSKKTIWLASSTVV